MKPVIATGRKKASLAKVKITPGTGQVIVNNRALGSLEPELARLKIMEPLQLVPELSKSVDIKIEVKGGGFMGRAEAARTAVARGLFEWSKDPKVREVFKRYDWMLIKSDVRFKETKKPGGPGARAKFQKSYR
ncbi:MAG: 30S ribosomal protein S9 [Candidatus Hadarchaeaceae archaeon]